MKKIKIMDLLLSEAIDEKIIKENLNEDFQEIIKKFEGAEIDPASFIGYKILSKKF